MKNLEKMESRLNEIERSIKGLSKIFQADEIMKNFKSGMYWVKDKDLKFIKTNKLNAELLYGCNYNTLIGKTDCEVFEFLNSNKEVIDNVSKTCSVSDLYILNKNFEGKYRPSYFLEFLKAHDGKDLCLFVAKEAVPSDANFNEAQGVMGMAFVIPNLIVPYITNILPKFIEQNIVERINDTVYRLNMETQ